jgi:hypothetical protein
MHKTPTQNPKPCELSPKNKKRLKKSTTRSSKSKDRLSKPLDSSEIRVVLSKRAPTKKGSIDLQKQSTPKASKKVKKKLFINTQLPLNLNSEIEKSCSRFDKDRARSNLEYSLKSKLNLSQKVLLNKNTSPKRVEQIIKNSLKKDRRDRIMKEKELKQKKLQEEIKKLENDYQNNLIRKINGKKYKKKLSPDTRSATGRGKLEKVVRLINKKIKSGRSVSSRRVPKDLPSVRSISAEKDRVSRFFIDDLYGNVETCREKIVSDAESRCELVNSRTEKEKVRRNVSLIEEDESFTVSPTAERNKLLAIKEKIDYKKYLVDKENLEEELQKKLKENQEFFKKAKEKSEEFRRKRAAKVIQKNLLRYVKVLRKEKQELKESKLQDFVNEQISWREAQLLSLEYLREKELQDMQSLVELLGQNPQLEDHLFKVVNHRYELFTRLFKNNLENAEQEIMQDMDTRQVLNLSNKIKDKKDEISKIIEETQMNSSVSKEEVKNMLKDVKDIVNYDLNSISCQTSIDLQESNKKKNGFEQIDASNSLLKDFILRPEIMDRLEQLEKEEKREKNIEKKENNLKKEKNIEKKEKNIEKEEKNIQEKKNDETQKPVKFSKSGPKILTEIDDTHIKSISINEILLLDSSLFSPTLSQVAEEDSPEKSPDLEPPSTSPIPARPSAPLMFLDTDDSGPLDSMISFSLPMNLTQSSKKPSQVLPLLNLGSIQGSMSSIPITSDPRIETSPEYIHHFLSEVFSGLDLSSLRAELSRGLSRDPLKELSKIRELDLGFLEKEPFKPIFNIPQIIERFQAEVSDEVTSQRLVNQADKIHKVMVLSVADEVMQSFRPYGIQGVPLIWSQKIRKINPVQVDLKFVIKSTIETVEEFSRFEIGKIPTEEMIQSNGKIDEELIQDIREDALGFAIKREIIEFDWVWTEYEFEETQVKLDLADMILADLAEELLQCS